MTSTPDPSSAARRDEPSASDTDTANTNAAAAALASAAASAAVLSQHAGVLEYGERSAPVRFIHAAASDGKTSDSGNTGAQPDPDRMRIVAAVEREVFDAEQIVIFAPDADPDPDRLGVVTRVQLLLHVRPLDTLDHAADRFQAYHGDPAPLLLADCTIDSVRITGSAPASDDAGGSAHQSADLIVDGDELRRYAFVRGTEPAVIRACNADRDRLASACLRWLGVQINQPMAVGADRLGIDIRAQFGVLRLPWPSTTTDPASAQDGRIKPLRVLDRDQPIDGLIGLVERFLATPDGDRP